MTANIGNTFHNFGRKEENGKIDYIFTDARPVAPATLWEDRAGEIWLSDHYPVAVELEI